MGEKSLRAPLMQLLTDFENKVRGLPAEKQTYFVSQVKKLRAELDTDISALIEELKKKYTKRSDEKKMLKDATLLQFQTKFKPKFTDLAKQFVEAKKAI